MIGETVGSYRVTAKLGSGGMGDVYRATDTRLGREVAIKFPTERFSERFEREARAVAALNHPNICTLYDVASNYLVVELVEGATLAERLTEGPIPLDEAPDIARQVSTGGGSIPIWSNNGRELFYRTDDQRIMVVPYTETKDAFAPGKPQLWSDVRLAPNNQRNLDITQDGKRFIALLPVDTSPGTAQRNHVVFLQNFADELDRRFNKPR